MVVPSLPGYGFSPAPARAVGPRQIARWLDQLMVEAFGDAKYLVQGGDWGALIACWLNYDGGGCAGVHINLMGWDASGAEPETDEERAYAARVASIMDDGLGYAHQQRTRPQTLSFAMHDSPVGTAAWILEKFYGWSDRTQGFDKTFTRDQLLTNIMLYVATDSFLGAALLYRGLQLERAVGYGLPAGPHRLQRPVAVANFPEEFLPWPPRSFVERTMNVVRWTDFDRGGHFPALECPTPFRIDLQACVRHFKPKFL